MRLDGDVEPDERAGGRESETAEERTEEREEVDFHKIFWEEYFPIAFAIGISMDEFKHMNPVKLEYCIKGYRLRQKMRDEEMWGWFGEYCMPAVFFAIDHNLRGDKAQSKYPKIPILQRKEKKEKIGTKESNEVIATFEMKLRAKRLKELGLPESPA